MPLRLSEAKLNRLGYFYMATLHPRGGGDTLTLLAPIPVYSFTTLRPSECREICQPFLAPTAAPMKSDVGVLLRNAEVQGSDSSTVSPASSPRSASPILPEDEVGPWCFDPRTDARTLKWWSRRYELFSRYDYGIRLDREGWYEVTPEAIAEHIAKKMTTNGIIVDAFCGVGGNTIAFAKLGMCSKVVAADKDPERVKMCRHNSAVYGFEVEEKIEFVDGSSDFRQFALAYCLQALHIRRQGADPHQAAAQWVFLSPPWGDRYPRSMASNKPFNLVLDLANGLDGAELLRTALRVAPDVCYYLPRNTCPAQLRALAEELGTSLELERPKGQSCHNVLVAYFRTRGSSCWPELPPDAVGASSSKPHVRGYALTDSAIERMPAAMRKHVTEYLASDFDPTREYQLSSTIPRCERCGAVRNIHNACFCCRSGVIR